MPTLDELKTIVTHLQQDLAKAQGIKVQFDSAINELNNLLTVMRGNAQLAESDRTDEAREELVRVVLENTARAHEIIETQLNAKVGGASAAAATASGETPIPASILIVDDNSAMCSMMARILAQEGHSTMQASNGHYALELCQSGHFDIVLLDIQLTDMNGIDVCRKLQTLSPRPSVVFFSGDPSIGDPTLLAREEGAVAFVRKPFDIHEIRNVVRLVLNQRRHAAS